MGIRFSWSAVLACTLSLTGAAHAQDDLASLAASDPNRFVSAVQQLLKESGGYAGDVNGVLTRATITAINQACQAAGVLAQCQIGPLSPTGASAVAEAVAAMQPPEDMPMASAEPVATPAEPEAAAVEPEAAPAEPEMAPMEPTATEVEPDPPMVVGTGTPMAVEWQMLEDRNGIKVSVGQNDAGYEAVLKGTAAGDDWTNIRSSQFINADAGQTWTFSITASADLTADGTAVAHLAAFGDDGYIEELSDGAVIEAGDAKAYAVTGVAPAGTVRVVPYIQFRYPEGTFVDDTVSFSDAKVAPGS